MKRIKKLITDFYLSETFIKIGLFIALGIFILLIMILNQIIQNPEIISLPNYR